MLIKIIKGCNKLHRFQMSGKSRGSSRLFNVDKYSYQEMKSEDESVSRSNTLESNISSLSYGFGTSKHKQANNKVTNNGNGKITSWNPFSE